MAALGHIADKRVSALADTPPTWMMSRGRDSDRSMAMSARLVIHNDRLQIPNWRICLADLGSRCAESSTIVSPLVNAAEPSQCGDLSAECSVCDDIGDRRPHVAPARRHAPGGQGADASRAARGLASRMVTTEVVQIAWRRDRRPDPTHVLAAGRRCDACAFDQ